MIFNKQNEAELKYFILPFKFSVKQNGGWVPSSGRKGNDIHNLLECTHYNFKYVLRNFFLYFTIASIIFIVKINYILFFFSFSPSPVPRHHSIGQVAKDFCTTHAKDHECSFINSDIIVDILLFYFF